MFSVESSELGILGLFLLFVFMYKNFNSLSLFSFMAMSYLINACITGGHYTANGGMLFFVFFYFAGRYVQQDAFLGEQKVKKEGQYFNKNNCRVINSNKKIVYE